MTLINRQAGRIAVHRGGRGLDDLFHLVTNRRFQDIQCASDKDIDSLSGRFGATRDSQRSLMKHIVSARSRALNCCRVTNVAFNHFEAWPLSGTGNAKVVPTAADEVIQNADLRGAR